MEDKNIIKELKESLNDKGYIEHLITGIEEGIQAVNKRLSDLEEAMLDKTAKTEAEINAELKLDKRKKQSIDGLRSTILILVLQILLFLSKLF